MAAAHIGLGNYAEAEHALQWMLDLRQGKADARGWLLVSRIREVTGDFEGALEVVYNAFRTLRPGDDADRVALLARAGHLHWLAGRLDDAERLLAEALLAAPDDECALGSLAHVRLARGRRTEAIGILERLAESTQRPAFLYRLAQLRGTAASYAAFEHAGRARMAAGDNANRELVLYYAGRGSRPVEALAIARKEAARRQDAWTLDALAAALQANGRSAEARAIMKRLLALGVRYREIVGRAARLGL
jgi:tetratricopeptide (TPR) repeat protein